jgi:hypothetical protein
MGPKGLLVTVGIATVGCCPSGFANAEGTMANPSKAANTQANQK